MEEIHPHKSIASFCLIVSIPVAALTVSAWCLADGLSAKGYDPNSALCLAALAFGLIFYGFAYWSLGNHGRAIALAAEQMSLLEGVALVASATFFVATGVAFVLSSAVSQINPWIPGFGLLLSFALLATSVTALKEWPGMGVVVGGRPFKDKHIINSEDGDE